MHERDVACLGNRDFLWSQVALRPQDRCIQTGAIAGPNPTAFLQHDAHAEATVNFFLCMSSNKRCHVLPAQTITLKVHSRFDSTTIPAAVRLLHLNISEVTYLNKYVCFDLCSRTGDGTAGSHYDVLLRKQANSTQSRVPLRRPLATAVHDDMPSDFKISAGKESGRNA